jgi:glycosyltransferase involved in cell wall biosynthesis
MNGSHIRVARVITRLNIGGPARHVTILSTRLGTEFDTVLLTGRPAVDEGSLTDACRGVGVRIIEVPELQRRPSPLSDLRALWRLYVELRRLRPDLVATHTAKAGVLGRLAACLAGVPIRIHTFHGHVFEGYFGGIGSTLVRAAERLLDTITTHFVAISPEVAAAINAAGIGRGKTTVINLGLDLDPFLESRPGLFKRELGVGDDQPCVGIVGRLVPIKAHRLFLDAASIVLKQRPDARFIVVGDGQLRSVLERRVAELDLLPFVHFTGWRSDLVEVYSDLDVAVCCSLNEGTPVCMIEASAAGTPVVGTAVGGMPSVICDGVTGLLVPSGDVAALAAAILSVLNDPPLAAAMAEAGRGFAMERYGSERMLQEVRRLYRELAELKTAEQTRSCPSA